MCPTRTTCSPITPAALLALAAALPIALGPTALGQNALGDGRALDGSLSTQSRYNAQRVDPTAEYRFRNAVATGNAPGGLSLRVDVGYRSATEFRGELGSDDLFSFRRDSLYSGLAGMGIRGTDAIQYQFALTTGSQLPQNLVGSGVVARGGARPDTTVSAPQGATPLRRPTVEERLESERLTGMLRSPSSYATTRSMRPVFLGNVASLTGEVNEQAVSASGLRGVRIVEMDTGATTSGTSDLAQAQRVRTAYDTIIESQLQRMKVDSSADAAQDEAATTQAAETWRTRLDALRQQMLIGEPQGPTQRPGQPQAEPGEPEPDEPGPTGRPRFDPETLKVLRPTGPAVPSLVDPDSPLNSVYIGHMEAGQHLLRTGRYFDAEERFTRALSIRSADVSAQVGRLHAQLGAGLFISAGLNLRELVLTSPEIAATRFASELLPDNERAADLVQLLRERAGLVEGRLVNDLTLQREAGLLLAYLSYQLSAGEGVAQGLAAAASTLSEAELENKEMDERLISYLTELWTPGEPASEAEAEPETETETEPEGE
ncbi:MAG: hypothetical protein ACI89L_001249 [Phycisphaerales bacterium]|jgi:hypothetical protein